MRRMNKSGVVFSTIINSQWDENHELLPAGRTSSHHPQINYDDDGNYDTFDDYWFTELHNMDNYCEQLVKSA